MDIGSWVSDGPCQLSSVEQQQNIPTAIVPFCRSTRSPIIIANAGIKKEKF